jgi:hypothetical protein
MEFTELQGVAGRSGKWLAYLEPTEQQQHYMLRAIHAEQGLRHKADKTSGKG